MRRIDSSGSQASRHVSRNVPDVPRPPPASPTPPPRRATGAAAASDADRSSCAGRARGSGWPPARAAPTSAAGRDRGPAEPAAPRAGRGRSRHRRRAPAGRDRRCPSRRRPRRAPRRARGAAARAASPASSPVASRDQVVGRRTESGGAQQPRDLDEEARDPVRTGMFEHVAVPARALDTGRVAGRDGEPTMGPRHPCRGDLQLGQPAQFRCVAGGGGRPASLTSSTGTCHAPQTTTTGPSNSRHAARMARRMWASRSEFRRPWG